MHYLLDPSKFKFTKTTVVHFSASVFLGVSLKKRYIIFINALEKNIS